MKSFDYDLFVIGAGSGGVRAGRIAAQYGARVAIAEGDRVGGTCVVRGCVPKKLYVTSSHIRDDLEDAAGLGWTIGDATFDWPTLRDNVNADTEWLSGRYIANIEKAGAELIRSRASLVDANHVRIHSDDRVVSARYILLATGGRPIVDSTIPGIEHAVVSDDVFHLESLPKRVLTVGGGYIALEFAGIFKGFGSDVTVLHRGSDVLRGFDADIRRSVHTALQNRQIDVLCEDTIESIEKDGALRVKTHAGRELTVDLVLMAIGRRPNTDGIGLDPAGVACNPDGSIQVDAFSRTTAESVYAVGDITNRAQLTPVAIREGEAVADTLFGGKPTAVDHSLIPTAVFTQPEVGTVGMTEEAAKAAHQALDIYTAHFKPLHHRVAHRDERMLLKLVVDAETDRVLGFHGVGAGTSEMAQLVAVALKMGATKADFDATIALHPTQAEELVTMREPVERYRAWEALPGPATVE